MLDVTKFPIAARWPAQHPSKIQLYSWPSPNGIKISAALEEMELPYEAHRVDILTDETWTAPFLSLNPNGKIPAIIDPAGPDGRPIALFESGAILVYLADKSGRLLPKGGAAHYETLQWVFFQNAAVGPIFGQLGYFHRFAGRQIEDKRPLERFRVEVQRLLGVVDGRLQGRQWIMGDEFTIADLTLFGWVRAITEIYDAAELVGYHDLTNVSGWLRRVLDRPAVARALAIPA